MSITGNQNNIFIHGVNLKILEPGKGLIFSDNTVLNTASAAGPDNNLTTEFNNVETAFVITEATSNTGFAGNTAPQDAISVSSNLFISFTGNLITNGQITAGSVANVEASITSNADRISTLESNIHLEGFKVGISPSDFTPSANLHVVGNVYATGNVNTATGTSMGIGTSTQSSVLSVVGTNPYVSDPIEAGIHIGQAPNGYAAIELVGDNNKCLIDFSKPGVGAGGHFYRLVSNLSSRNNLEIFAPGDTIALTVDESAHVGIGTTSPSANLHIQGLTRTANAVISNVPTLSIDNSFDLNYGPDRDFRWNFRRDNGDAVTAWGGDLILSDWNATKQLDHILHIKNYNDTTPGAVGIGTSSPGYKLDVAGVINGSTLRIDGGTGNLYVPGVIYTDGNWGMLFRAAVAGLEADFAWFDSSAGNGVELMRLEDGKLGIGTTSPYAKLHVVGASGGITSVSPHRSYFVYGNTALTNTGTNWGDMSIYANDDIVSGAYIGSVKGTIGASDRRIKSNIQDINDTLALEQLRLLQPKTYQYKDVRSRGTELVIGFIAQEVKEVIPTAVTTRTQSIPNIYEIGNVSQSNVITFTNFDTSNLQANSNIINIKTVTGGEERVTLANVIDEHTIQVVEDLSTLTGSVDENGNVITETITTTYTQEEYDALESKNGINITYTPEITKDDYEALTDEEKEVYTLSYSKTETVNVGDQIFVYGQEVNDFNFLKKESVFTIATAALQEVDRQQQADKARIATLESRVETLLTRIEALENNNP